MVDPELILAEKKRTFLKACQRGIPPEKAAEKAGVPYALFLARVDSDPDLAFLKIQGIQSSSTLTAKKKVTRKKTTGALPADSLGYKKGTMEKLLKGGKGGRGNINDLIELYQISAHDDFEDEDPEVAKRGQEKVEFLMRHIWVALMPRETAAKIEQTKPKKLVEVTEISAQLQTVRTQIQARLAEKQTANQMRAELAKGDDDTGEPGGSTPEGTRALEAPAGEAGDGQPLRPGAERETVGVRERQPRVLDAEWDQPAGEVDDPAEPGGVGGDGGLPA